MQYLCFFAALGTKVIKVCREGSCFLASRQFDDFFESRIIGPGKRKDFVLRIVQMSGLPILSYYPSILRQVKDPFLKTSGVQGSAA
jgi:hypothetical protein